MGLLNKTPTQAFTGATCVGLDRIWQSHLALDLTVIIRVLDLEA